MFRSFKWYLSFTRYMGAVYTANLIVLHVITRNSTNHEPPHVIVSITLPVPLPQHRQIQTKFCANTKQRAIRHFVTCTAGRHTQLHKTGAMFFYGVTHSTFQGHNPSLIQAPLPAALNPFRWILKIPGFTAIKYSSRTQKTAPPTFYVLHLSTLQALSITLVHSTVQQWRKCMSSSISHFVRRVTEVQRMWRCMGVGGQLQDLSVLNLSTHAAVQFISTVASSALRTLFLSATQNRKSSGPAGTQNVPEPTDQWPRGDPNGTSA